MIEELRCSDVISATFDRILSPLTFRYLNTVSLLSIKFNSHSVIYGCCMLSGYARVIDEVNYSN